MEFTEITKRLRKHWDSFQTPLSEACMLFRLQRNLAPGILTDLVAHGNVCLIMDSSFSELTRF
jgi:hypothetical protein